MVWLFLNLTFDFKLYNLNSLNIPIYTEHYSAWDCCRVCIIKSFTIYNKLVRVGLFIIFIFTHIIFLFIHKLIFSPSSILTFILIIFILYSRNIFFITNKHKNSWLFKFVFFNIYLNLKKFLSLDVNTQFIWYYSVWFIFTLFNLASLLPKIPAFTSFILIPMYFSFWIFTVNNFKSIISSSENCVLLYLPGRLDLHLTPLVIFIEFISYLIRPISLSVRLFANILSGHILVHIMAGYACIFFNNNFFSCFFFITLVLITLNVLEYFIAIIQSTVFVLIAVITQADTTNF